ncbi:MAG TPA: hypothetical protein PLZ62_00575 [bacterium]|nr:hypothetical protein [bacterium]
MFKKENICVLISSLGFTEFDRKMCTLIRHAGFDKVGVTILGGMIVDVRKTANNICKYSFDHFCGDIPDVNWNYKRLVYDWEMVNRDRSKKSCIDWLKRVIIQMGIWRLYSVIDKKMLISKINVLVENTKDIVGKKWIRWDSRGVIENLDILDSIQPDLNIVVEYYPESHHPYVFPKFIQKLNEDYKQNFWISIDPGHFHRAKYLYSDCRNIRAEYWVENYLWEPDIAGLIRMIEISNLQVCGQNAHNSVFDGVIDFERVFGLLGKGLNKRKIDPPFFWVIEATPLSKDELCNNMERKLNIYYKKLING